MDCNNLNNSETDYEEDSKPFGDDSDSVKEQHNGFAINLDKEEEMNLPEEKAKSNNLFNLFDWLEVIVTAMVAVILMFSLVFRIATIQGPSMMDTLHNGEKVIITDLNYKPQRGDIVIVSRNISNSVEGEITSDLPIIKRIIGVGGDTVDIDFERGVVSVNGKELDEPYARVPTTQKKDIDFPVYVPEGYIFVLGDNRGNSLDSRSTLIGENGMINQNYILGHAIFRLFPFNKIGGLK